MTGKLLYFWFWLIMQIKKIIYIHTYFIIMLFPDIGINEHEYMNSCFSEQVDRNSFYLLKSLVLQILNRQSFQKKLFQSKPKQKRIINHTKTMSFQGDSPAVCLLWLSSSSAQWKDQDTVFTALQTNPNILKYFICLRQLHIHVVISKCHNHYSRMLHCISTAFKFS